MILGGLYFDIDDLPAGLYHFGKIGNLGAWNTIDFTNKGYDQLFSHPKIYKGIKSLARNEYQKAKDRFE